MGTIHGQMLTKDKYFIGSNGFVETGIELELIIL
jgi:hypothetical protein